MWHFARSVQQGVVFTSYSYGGWKVDLFWKSQAQRVMDRPRPSIHIDRKTESLCQKYDALCLAGPEGRGVFELLKPGETVNNKHYQQQLINLNHFLLEKRAEYRRRQHKIIFLRDTVSWHTAKPVRNTLKVLSWKVLVSAVYLPSLRLQLICIDESRSCWAALWSVRRCEKVARWMICRKGGRFLLS